MRWKLHVRFGKRAGETDQQNANTAPRSDFTRNRRTCDATAAAGRRSGTGRRRDHDGAEPFCGPLILLGRTRAEPSPQRPVPRVGLHRERVSGSLAETRRSRRTTSAGVMARSTVARHGPMEIQTTIDEHSANRTQLDPTSAAVVDPVREELDSVDRGDARVANIAGDRAIEPGQHEGRLVCPCRPSPLC